MDWFGIGMFLFTCITLVILFIRSKFVWPIMEIIDFATLQIVGEKILALGQEDTEKNRYNQLNKEDCISILGIRLFSIYERDISRFFMTPNERKRYDIFMKNAKKTKGMLDNMKRRRLHE